MGKTVQKSCGVGPISDLGNTRAALSAQDVSLADRFKMVNL